MGGEVEVREDVEWGRSTTRGKRARECGRPRPGPAHGLALQRVDGTVPATGGRLRQRLSCDVNSPQHTHSIWIQV